MDERFQIAVTGLQKTGQVKKSDYHLSILREGSFSVTVERLPLVEYFIFFDDPIKANQIKVKIYKTLDGRWYDRNYSDEAEIYSPEFGVPEINDQVKYAIDEYESKHQHVGEYI